MDGWMHGCIDVTPIERVCWAVSSSNVRSAIYEPGKPRAFISFSTVTVDGVSLIKLPHYIRTSARIQHGLLTTILVFDAVQRALCSPFQACLY